MVTRLVRLCITAVKFNHAAAYRHNVYAAESRIGSNPHALRMWQADCIIANDAYNMARVKFMNAANAFEVEP